MRSNVGEDLRPPGASQHTCGSSSPQKIRETLGEDVVDPFEPLVHRQCMSTQLPRTAHGVICAHLEDVGR